jgi:hypothetical protein
VYGDSIGDGLRFYWRFCRDTVVGSLKSLLQYCDRISNRISFDLLITICIAYILHLILTCCLGYYKNQTKTAESFVDGYFRTGDIGEIDSKGKLHIIDRIKNILELYVNGRSVWIASGVLESLYIKCPLVLQIFIHGKRDEDAVIAVVVPSIPIEDPIKFKKELQEEFIKIAATANLEEFSIIWAYDCIVDTTDQEEPKETFGSS